MESVTKPLEQEIAKLKKQRDALAEALNEIDDYFEYRYRSSVDREFVYGVFLRLCEELGTPENR